jgi:hypothetical protein
MAIRKAHQGKKNIGNNQVDTYYFDVEKCKICSLKQGCYKEGSMTKNIFCINKIRITSRTNCLSGN